MARGVRGEREGGVGVCTFAAVAAKFLLFKLKADTHCK